MNQVAWIIRPTPLQRLDVLTFGSSSRDCELPYTTANRPPDTGSAIALSEPGGLLNMWYQKELSSRDNRGGVLSEEKFLRYRLDVVQKMADGPFKAAIVSAITTRTRTLQERLGESLHR